ncbi:MAG: hypothetical protein Q7U14_02815 [Lacisediminimonas sp.]|nr:hypothetical protein [Lacisediminimonas sp.]
MRLREQGRTDAEVGQRDAARVVARHAGMQPRLVADERDGVARMDGNTVGADRHAGVGIESAGNVQRQHRTGNPVDRQDCVAQLAIDAARKSNAEQSIQDQVPGLVKQRRCVSGEMEGHAALAGMPVGQGGIAAQGGRGGVQQHMRIMSGLA